ncbi:hypothetical protein C7415_102249 [Cupriavidus alkaliphilus]|uniref:Uncharacterized protein n=1 Tax=Cupriavidus alkaliphilus TaxID=942866 RepID=A0A1C3UKC0_9BURK|nr:hypothetical protein [Cupriavidus alkaliphilus]MBB3006336.1 hypothetical protein [Cupriavidus alkaliphilus]MBB3011750.1 hypothetical protein [Cupriavidus alkaliphilus]RAS11128.1 hypothetical protein C7415_102249 [Cupriavidus alkaliphilus]SCB15898.1 hypothetical protein GA0116996_103306 [Cupriavidus alkaliphilus]
MPGAGVPTHPVPRGAALANAPAAAAFRIMRRPVPAGAGTVSEIRHPSP